MFGSRGKRITTTRIGRSILEWEMSPNQGRGRRGASQASPSRERRAPAHNARYPWIWPCRAPTCCRRSFTTLASPSTPYREPSTTRKIRIGPSPNSRNPGQSDRTIKAASTLDRRTPVPAMLTAILPRGSRMSAQPTSCPTLPRCRGATPQ